MLNTLHKPELLYLLIYTLCTSIYLLHDKIWCNAQNTNIICQDEKWYDLMEGNLKLSLAVTPSQAPTRPSAVVTCKCVGDDFMVMIVIIMIMIMMMMMMMMTTMKIISIRKKKQTNEKNSRWSSSYVWSSERWHKWRKSNKLKQIKEGFWGLTRKYATNKEIEVKRNIPIQIMS